SRNGPRSPIERYLPNGTANTLCRQDRICVVHVFTTSGTNRDYFWVRFYISQEFMKILPFGVLIDRQEHWILGNQADIGETVAFPGDLVLSDQAQNRAGG